MRKIAGVSHVLFLTVPSEESMQSQSISGTHQTPFHSFLT